MDKGKTAVIIGATGLVGNHLLKILLQDGFFAEVKVLVRRSTLLKNIKLKEFIVNFDDASSYENLVQGDVLFSCMGTTIKKAGSKEAQWKIDYTYQYEGSQIAKKNKLKTMVLVSSSGANSKSNIFYSRMKGELEDAVRKLNFENYFIFRPSLLLGERAEVRVGEKIGEQIGKVLTLIPGFKKYKPIQGQQVALAMSNVCKMEDRLGEQVFELDEIFNLL